MNIKGKEYSKRAVLQKNSTRRVQFHVHPFPPSSPKKAIATSYGSHARTHDKKWTNRNNRINPIPFEKSVRFRRWIENRRKAIRKRLPFPYICQNIRGGGRKRIARSPLIYRERISFVSRVAIGGQFSHARCLTTASDRLRISLPSGSEYKCRYTPNGSCSRSGRKDRLCVRFLSIIPANLWKTGKQEIASESSTTILEIVREEEGKKGKKREETGVDMVCDDETHGVF